MGDLMTKQMWNDRHDEIIADTKKFIKQIAARYKAAYTYCIYQRLRRNFNGKSEQSLLLDQRKWQNYNRPLQSGSVYILSESDHRKWRRRYCVLQSNYTFEVYDSEEDFASSNRPRSERKHGSFDVVDNVDSHLSHVVKEYLRDFGYFRENVTHIIKKLGSAFDSSKRPTQHVLGLYHEYRGTFYMAVESAVEKDKWLKCLQDARRHLAGVQCEDSTQREAFELAIRLTCDAEEHCNVTVKMAGTQEEIIGDFITAYLSNGCKTMLQTKVKGDALKKFKMWGSLSRTLHATVGEIVMEDYPPLRATAEAEAEELQQKILTSMPALNAAYEAACAEVVAGLEASFHDELEVKILPKIADLVAKMGDSMLTSLREVKEVFVTLAEKVQHQVGSTSTEFANNIDKYFLSHLDVAPRNPETMQNAFHAVSGKKSPFGILSETFPKADCSKYEAKLCVLLQKLLDSAICTFEVLCGETVAKNDGHLHAADITKIEGRVLKKLTHDNAVLAKLFLTETMCDLVFEMLRSFAYFDARNKMRNYADVVPTELKTLLPMHGIYRHAVCGKIEEDLRPLLTTAFNGLARDHFNMSRYRSSNTINSHSSEEAHTPVRQRSPPDPSSDLAAVPSGETQESDTKSAEDPGVGEKDARPGKPQCFCGYDMDGETGEFLVDENGEIVPQDHSQKSKAADLEESACETTSGDSPVPLESASAGDPAQDNELKEDSAFRSGVNETGESTEDVVVRTSAQDNDRLSNTETDLPESFAQPTSDAEETGESDAAQPRSDGEKTAETDAAETGEPDAAQPASDAEETGEPDASQLTSDADETGEPDAAQPTSDGEKTGETDAEETGEPDASQLASDADETGEPDAAQPTSDAEETGVSMGAPKCDSISDQGFSAEVDENGEPCHVRPEDSADLLEEPRDLEEIGTPDDSAKESHAAEAVLISDGKQGSEEQKENGQREKGVSPEVEVENTRESVEDQCRSNGDSGEIKELVAEKSPDDFKLSEEVAVENMQESVEDQCHQYGDSGELEEKIVEESHDDLQAIEEVEVRNTQESVEDQCRPNCDSGERKERVAEESNDDFQVNEEEENHQPDGDAKQNGQPETLQDAVSEETSPVPTMRQKNSTADGKDSQIAISVADNDDNGRRDCLQSTGCGVEDSAEKYNGVVEQIVQTGVEKLI